MTTLPGAPAPVQDVEAGRYIVVQTKSWFGRIIRWATHSQYDHVLISLGAGLIAEATPREGVHVARLSEYAGCLAMVNYGEELTPAQLGAVAAAARAMAETGVPYNMTDIADLGLEDLGVTWAWLLRLSGADHMLICSAMVADCGAAATPPLDWLCGRGQSCQVRPSDLAARPVMVKLQILGA